MGQARSHRHFSKRFVPIGIVFSILICIAAGLVLWRAIHRDADSDRMQSVDIHWGYAEDIGPARWGDLSPAFKECKQGLEQSPIDLTGDAEARPYVLEFRYLSSSLEIVNNGHTIQVNYVPGSMLISDGRQYALLQFHFHRSSEHTVDGQPADMEVHLVHRDAAGNIAVVGVFLTAGRHNEALQQVWANMPAEKSKKRLVDGVTVNAADLQPQINPTIATPDRSRRRRAVKACAGSSSEDRWRSPRSRSPCSRRSFRTLPDRHNR